MFRLRRYAVFFFLISILLALQVRLFYLQVLESDKYLKLAGDQHNRVLRVEPRRGAIYDRNMEYLALNREVPSIYCDPGAVRDAEKTAEELSKILKIDREVLLKSFGRQGMFAWMKRKVDPTVAEKVEDLDLEGIYFMAESQRSYPNETMACHVLGCVNIDNKGIEGVELTFNNKLRGKEGLRHLVRDAKRRAVLYDESESIPPQNGYNLILTIDSMIQYITEEELEKVARKFNAERASAIVMEPFSGKILAMANYPAYDPNKYAEATKESMRNSAVCDVFEPGSVFKVITAGAALNENIISLNDIIDCERGKYRTGGRILSDYHAYGNLTFREVISKSSNIGTVKVAQKLGKARLYDYIKRFGFGQKTGSGLLGEVKGISRPPSIWSRSDITTIPIGQGIAVTPLQLASAISVVANGGYLMKPYIVESITTPDSEVYKEFEPVKKHRVLKEETCDKIKDALKHVMSHGTGRRAASKKYEFCGKTGTAQMASPNGGYYPDKYYATFMGFAPADEPLISIIVTARDPHPVHFGGSVAGPAFKRIAERSLEYLESNEQ